MSVPTGTLIFVAQSSAPSGYLKADGSAISRTTYASLFSVIGTTYGVGDGSTTFNVPDQRGCFTRGWDNGAGVDSGRSIGSFQDYALQNFTGDVTNLPSTGSNKSSDGVWTPFDSKSIPNAVTSLTGTDTGGFHFRPQNIARTSNETRPVNLVLTPCIKF